MVIHLTMADLPPYTATDMSSIRPAHDRVVAKFATNETRSVEYRLQQLKALYWAIKDQEHAITEACQLDLGKGDFETYLCETGWVLNDILYMIKNLAKWTQDEKPEDMGLMNMPVRPRIRKDPLGAVLVIGCWNFPIQLTLGPFIGAIAAGCTAVLKPSENAPNAARVMQKIVENSLDPSAYQVVQGAVPETTALLDLKWDKIFYTGSANVGQIIAQRAAETLTPVTLELGGRNPAFVTANADLRLAARRLIWAKLLNVGQVCVSQNYILVERSVLPSLVDNIRLALADFQPKGARDESSYGKIVNARNFSRLQEMLSQTSGKILLGGNSNKETLFFEPTVVEVSSPLDSLIATESFGPLIPILAYDTLDEAIALSNTVHATPLGIYPFGSKAETDKILASTRSGGASVNDGFFHASIPTLAFGGVGDSGSGSYRGKASFDTFTHRRSITTTPGWMEGLLAVRYPPFTQEKLKKFRSMNEQKPGFDREGRDTGAGGWLWWGVGLAGLVGAGVVSRQMQYGRSKL
ncbi:hypothetical protein MBLNU230_g4085t1 [Neophaeotheca triangularis]